MAEVGQVKEPAALEGQQDPPAETPAQTGTAKKRAVFNAILGLLVLIGAILLKDLSPFVKAVVGAASLCPALVTFILSLYDKDLKKDFKKEARDILESRKCTWSLVFPAVLVWTVDASLAGSFGWTERLIRGEPVVLRVVPAEGVMQILDGAGTGKGERIVLRLHYHGRSKDYPLDSAGVIYMGSSEKKLRAQFERLDTDEKTVSDEKKQRSDNLQEKLKQYLTKKGVPKENLDQFLTVWGPAKYLDTPVFRAGEEVGIDLVCAESHKIMVRIPDFRLSSNQDPVYLECLEEHNPCAPPS